MTFRKISLYALSGVLLAFVTLGCRATAAPDSGFLVHPEEMHDDDRMPFNAVWFSEKLNWDHYSEIYIAPVDTTHLEKMDWWDKMSFDSGEESIASEAKILAKYMKEELEKEFGDDPKMHFTVVDEVSDQTLILEMAIVQVVPTKVWLNTIGYILFGALDQGTTAMEGRFKNSEGEVLAKFKDREHGQVSLASIADMQWYSHAHHTIDHWSEKIVEITDSHPGDIVSSNYTVTLRPW